MKSMIRIQITPQNFLLFNNIEKKRLAMLLRIAGLFFVLRESSQNLHEFFVSNSTKKLAKPGKNEYHKSCELALLIIEC